MPQACWLGPRISEMDRRMRDPGTTARHNSGPRPRTLRSVAASDKPVMWRAEGKRARPPPARLLPPPSWEQQVSHYRRCQHSVILLLPGYQEARPSGMPSKRSGRENFVFTSLVGTHQPQPLLRIQPSVFIHWSIIAFLISSAHCGLLQKLASSHPPSTNSRLPSNPCTSSPPLYSWILAGQA